MAANSRFAIAIHTLGVLAFVGDESVSSEMIAESVDTNPVVIRRIIRKFVKHGLVVVQMGTGGGSRLSRDPGEISLADIYSALDEDKLFNVPGLGDDHVCPVGRVIRPVLEEIFDGVEGYLGDRLRKTSLKDVMDQVANGMPAGFCQSGNKG
jgi:Rrf2 family protein